MSEKALLLVYARQIERMQIMSKRLEQTWPRLEIQHHYCYYWLACTCPMFQYFRCSSIDFRHPWKLTKSYASRGHGFSLCFGYDRRYGSGITFEKDDENTFYVTIAKEFERRGKQFTVNCSKVMVESLFNDLQKSFAENFDGIHSHGECNRTRKRRNKKTLQEFIQSVSTLINPT